jgi:hypothetical protein
MGTSGLVKLDALPVQTPSDPEQLNQIIDAMCGTQVMRDPTTGVIEDNVHDIGGLAVGRPAFINVGTGIRVAGQTLNIAPFLLSLTGIQSGAAKVSGYPAFLSPAGGTGNTFDVLGGTTPLTLTIDGVAKQLRGNITSDALSLAPSSNNTCLVNDVDIAGDPVWSKTIGEFGQYLTIDTVGSEITALNGTIQCFKITNGSETEVFIASIDTAHNQLIPLIRGIGGTNRIAFSDDDMITLLKAHWIFLDDDLLTIDTTDIYPSRGFVAPLTPSTGQYWLDSSESSWKRYSGVNWEKLGRIYLGMAICDSAGCKWVEHADFNLQWNGTINNYDVVSLDATIFSTNATSLKVNVAGVLVETNQINLETITFSNIEPGYTEQASTWYYLYVSKYGEFILSPVVPRKKDERLGWYHPSEYWRCIAFFYNNSSSDFSGLGMNVGSGDCDITMQEVKTEQATTGGEHIHHLNMPPIVQNVSLTVWQASANTTTLPLFIGTGKNGPGFIQQVLAIHGVNAVPSSRELRQVGNAQIRFEVSGTYTIDFFPSSMKIDW